ncbi:hypothetical protein LTR37_021527 [Vermiconidia calcicola]|uniref:Uncharacterized protein n=1 Tax=Vermiconidia calcicola TaxID=1690605 RepID=A0ACC3M9P9_9PEZI|nr:hypothetical protein LTR37_021527 [Vermiconidia calcicola]
MGFDAVWISPVTTQIKGNTPFGYAYHGYWQQDLYEINSHFGTADDLRALSRALHSRGMYLMVDVVVNHNGWNGAPRTVDYSAYNPFNKKSYYHPHCTIDFSVKNSTNIEECWLGDDNVALPDLRTENSFVALGYRSWIKELVSNYSIDGLRLDTVMEVNTGFWAGFVRSAGVYMFGEIFDGDASYVCSFQDYIPGV